MNMTSTELTVGMSGTGRPSSRVLKPPGGGHSNIFAEPEVSVNAPRPKYNQQNSSNLIACMGARDPNQEVEKLREEIQAKPSPDNGEPAAVPSAGKSAAATNGNGDGGGNDSNSTRGRVPPGGFSSGGFW